MNASKLFIKTLKENPKEAHIESHKLLIKGSFIKQVSSGIYFYLPLGIKVKNNIIRIIKSELEKIDFLESYCPLIVPKEYLIKSGRYDVFGDNMLKFTDRHKQEYVLGPTHEEHYSELISKEIKSYKNLPIKLYQINHKFRDEIRPRFGPIRSREFLMKDAYSYHSSKDCLNNTYNEMKNTYNNIFKNLNLKTIILHADSGAMGGNKSEEFMVENQIGEESIVKCKKCNYKNNKTENKNICPVCTEKLTESKIIELAHIFDLDQKYTKSHNVKYVNKFGKEEFAVMGCYGIGVDRIISTIIEENYDKDGIIWPKNISPYHVVVNPINYKDENQRKMSHSIYNILSKKNIKVILEDRDISISQRFKDWDLIGIPSRINVGKKALTENMIEIKHRNNEKAIFKTQEQTVNEIIEKYNNQ